MILFGASGHCKVVLEILIQNGEMVEAIYDDSPRVSEIFGIKVLKNNLQPHTNEKAIISIGNNEVRKRLAEKYKNLRFQRAIHKTAAISDFSNIGEGTVVMANALVNPDTKIGRQCILNTGAVIEHDCMIDDFVHISPNASLAGNVTVGEGTQVGIGASVIQGVTIGKWCIIGAGAVIIKDVPDFSVVVGNPGKIIKKNTLKI